MKTKIKIHDTNIAKIENAIREAEGRATARTITAGDVFRAIQEIETALNIPKKYTVGITAHIDYNAQVFPRAYKYTPESTHFEIERAAAGWYITSISRDTCGRKRYRLTLTEDAKKAIIDSKTAF